MNFSKILLIFSIFILFIQTAYGLSVGVIPGVEDLGEVKKGQEVTMEFYVNTDYDGTLPVSLSFIQPSLSYLNPSGGPNYKFNSSEASQEVISDWIIFVEKRIYLNNEKETYKLEGGGYVTANGRFEAVLEVPDNAEPGFHYGSINLKPDLDFNTRGTGVTTIGVFRPTFVFRVEGDAVRSGEILGFNSKRLDENFERVEVFFKNTGTVTMNSRLDSLKIYVNDEVVELNSAYKVVKPGDIVRFDTKWPLKNTETGNYLVTGTVSWITGSTTKQGDIQVTAAPSAPVAKAVEAAPFPWWIVLILILIFFMLIYYKKR
jgi:hypothetical protein